MINFTVSAAERVLIARIVDRVMAMECLHREPSERRRSMEIEMDFCAVQNSSTPLDLNGLLDADDFNFAHDAFGIARHLDRRDDSETAGELGGFFLPRYAIKSRGPVPTDPPWLRQRFEQLVRIRSERVHAAPNG